MKRFLPLLIILAVALIGVGAGTLLYRSKMQVTPTTAAKANGSTAKSALAATSPLPADSKHAHERGPTDAPVTLEIYGDFQCPACATTSAVIDELLPAYGRNVRLVFHEFPLAMHAHALQAAMAAEAASAQGKFWPMHDMLYKYQNIWGKVADPMHFFSAYAQSLGLDVERFEADSVSGAVKGDIMTEGDSGVARGVKNTPTLYVNGEEVRGAFSRENLKAALDTALAAKGKS